MSASTVSSLSFVCCFWLCGSVAALTIQIGTLQPFPVPDVENRGYRSYQRCFGLQAAFDEANAAQALGPGVLVDLTVRAAYDAGDVRNKALAENLLSASNATLIAASSSETTAEALAASELAGTPLVAAFASDPTSLYAANSSVAVNFRFSFGDEQWQMINVAWNSKLRCKRYGIAYYYANGPEALAAEMALKLNDWGHHNVTLGPFGQSASMWNSSVTAILSNRPHCVFFLGEGYAVQDFMIALMDHPSFVAAETYFISSSSGNSPLWRDARLQNRTFVVQQVPSPLDVDFDIVKRYRSALAAFDAKGYYDPAGKGFALPANYGRDASPNYFSLEGYIIGRFVVEILKRATRNNFTGANLLSAVFGQKMFVVDDLLLGPYMAGCTGRQNLTKLPCHSNSGNKLIFTSYLGADNQLRPYVPEVSPYMEDASVGQFEMSYTVLKQTDLIVRTPTLFVCVFDVTVALMKPSGLTAGVLYSLFFSAFFLTAGYLGLSAAVAGDLVNVFEYTLSVDDATLHRYVDRYPLAGFAGGAQRTNFNVTGYFSTSGYDGGQYRLTDPPLSEWREEVIGLEPVLADFVHALAAKLADDAARSGDTPHVTILASSSAEAELASKSMHTFQLTFDDPMVYGPYSGSASAQLNLYRELRQRISDGMDDVHRVLFVVSQNGALIDSVVKLAINEMPRLRVFLATSEECLEDSLNGMTPAQRAAFDAQRHNIFFSSVFTPFFHRLPFNILPNSAAEAYESILVTVPGVPFSFSGLRGTRIAGLLYSAQSAVANIISASRFLSVWYDQGTIATADQQVGRFFRTPCLPEVIERNAVDRSCQCSKGPRSFFVHSLTDWALESFANATNVSFRYTHPHCGVLYEPLKVSPKQSALLGTLVGSIGGAAVLLIAAVAAYTLTRPARDNRYAPKESPFTIVFTDIQSSTLLWARAPQEMAEAVETHHALIRRLISKHRAYEVKTVGDSFMIACVDAIAAVRLAVDLQVGFFGHHWAAPAIDEAYKELERQQDEELAAQSYTHTPLTAALSATSRNSPSLHLGQTLTDGNVWNGLRVRIGIHTGVGEIKYDKVSLGYDYYGTVVNTAARVEGVGHGGQILVSEAAFDAAGGYSAVVDASTVCLGPQLLRGLDEPVVLYQVNPTKLKGRLFPALRLEVEREVESETSGTETTSLTSAFEATADAMAMRTARRVKGDGQWGPLYGQLTLVHGFTAHLFSTQTERQRRQLLDQLAAKWRIPLSTRSSSLSGPELFDRQLMALVLKAFPSYEKRATLPARKPSIESVRTQYSNDKDDPNARSASPSVLRSTESLLKPVYALPRVVSASEHDFVLPAADVVPRQDAVQ